MYVLPTEKVIMRYNSNSLLSSASIITTFIMCDNPVPIISPPSQRQQNLEQKKNVELDHSFQLDCITAMGQMNPYCEVSSNVFCNGIFSPQCTLLIELWEETFIIHTIYKTTINFDLQLSGNCTYIQPSINKPSSSVIITTCDCK